MQNLAEVYDSGSDAKFDMIRAYANYYLLYRGRLMTVEHSKSSVANIKRGT